MEDEEELPPPFYDSEGEYIMKQEDRDILQGKMAEGIHNIWRSVDKIEKHLDKLNGAVAKNTVFCGENKTGNRNLWRTLIILTIVFSAASGLGIAF